MKHVKVLMLAGCMAILALTVIDRAQAAIVPFDGTEYSWLHSAESGDPRGDWVEQINDTIAVRAGDAMQFRNRWYNSYAGTADIRISYGGGIPYTCAGADEYVFMGLNYGNYYPSGTDAVPFYATVLDCAGDSCAISVNHQYVYNGIMYGAGPWGRSMGFRMAAATNASGYNDTDTGQFINVTSAAVPDIAALPAATDKPAAEDALASTPGFRVDAMLLISGALATICLFRGWLRK